MSQQQSAPTTSANRWDLRHPGLIMKDGEPDAVFMRECLGVLNEANLDACPVHQRGDDRNRRRFLNARLKPDLTIPDYPDIYVIGDLASAVDAEGDPLPGLAPVAMQGGIYAATAILRKVKGQPELLPFITPIKALWRSLDAGQPWPMPSGSTSQA